MLARNTYVRLYAEVVGMITQFGHQSAHCQKRIAGKKRDYGRCCSTAMVATGFSILEKGLKVHSEKRADKE